LLRIVADVVEERRESFTVCAFLKKVFRLVPAQRLAVRLVVVAVTPEPDTFKAGEWGTRNGHRCGSSLRHGRGIDSEKFIKPSHKLVTPPAWRRRGLKVRHRPLAK